MTSEKPSLVQSLTEQMQQSLADDASVFLIKRLALKIKGGGENPAVQKKVITDIRQAVKLFVDAGLADLVYRRMLNQLERFL